MKAIIHKTTKEIEIINDPRQVAAAEAGELTVGKRTVLITKGGDIMVVCQQVYSKFSKEKDSLGKPFVFSRKAKGLAHSDPVWHNRTKVTGPQFEEYVLGWFQPVDKITCPSGDALILANKLPKFFSALMMQGRFSGKFLELFEMVD
jgi:hypothetical protein